MKNKILIFAILISSFALFVSCEYKVKPYEGDAGIYFDVNTSDIIAVTWITVPGEIQEREFEIRITTLGRTTNYDRPFEIELANVYYQEYQAQPNIDYKPFSLSGVIPANEAATVLKITLLRNPQYFNEGVTRILTLHLKENEHFKFLFNRSAQAEQIEPNGDTTEYTRYVDIHRTLKINELANRQIWWKGSDRDIHKDFGVWSAKKSLMLCDRYEFDRELWLSGNYSERLTQAYIRFMGKDTARFLEEEKAAGRTVYEVDGVTEMTMGPDAY